MFQLLIFFSFFIFLTNGIGYGVFQTIKHMAADYYGDIQVVFKKKISGGEASKLERDLKKIFPHEIQELFLYGIHPGVVSLGEDNLHSVYLLNYVSLCSRIFLEKKDIRPGLHGYVVGKNLFARSGGPEKKRVALFSGRGQRKKSLSCDIFPLFFSGYCTFLSDEWNDKLIMVPNKKFENFFEKKGIQYLQIYLFEKKQTQDIIFHMQRRYSSLIHSIQKSEEISIENEIFSSIIKISIHLIIMIFFLISFFFLYFFMRLYLHDNAHDYQFLISIGVSRAMLLSSLMILFQFLVVAALVVGFSGGFFFIKIINYYHFINWIYSFPLVFICSIEKSVLLWYVFFYLWYTLFISFWSASIILLKNE